MQGINDTTKGAVHRLLVFDNCRNNPADGWRQTQAQDHNMGIEKPLRAIAEKALNTLTLFSTAPGGVALDGPPGQNSPFAAALLRQLGGESVDIQTLPARLRRDLLLATNARQVVYELNSYREPYLLRGARGSTAGGAGITYEPGRLVELDKTYAFARENGLVLPAGLVALRPPAGSPDSQKIGAFRYSVRRSFGISPQVMVIMSIDDGHIAQIAYAGRSDGGNFWGFITGKISANRLEYRVTSASSRTIFDWHNANSGSFSMMGDSGQAYTGSFTRLDG